MTSYVTSCCGGPFRPRARSGGSFLCPADAVRSCACGNAGADGAPQERSHGLDRTATAFPAAQAADAGIFQAEISSFALRLAAEGKAAKTIRTYTEAVQWFAAAWLPGQASGASWEQVSSQDIQRWVAWLLGRYSSAYASNQYRALQQFFKWLAAEDQLPDPMAGLQPPRLAAKLVPVFTPRS